MTFYVNVGMLIEVTTKRCNFFFPFYSICMSGMCFLESFFFGNVLGRKIGLFFFQEKDAGAGLDSETDWKVIALSKERDILLLFFNSPYVSRDRLSDLGFGFF